ncbi:MAG: 2-phospho-L-lactate guanylyltransferase [Halobacteriota archaeon]
MEFLVPFDGREPKSRLASVLAADERRELATALLSDVLGAFERTPHEPHVLSTVPIDRPVPTTVDERPLTDAVNAALEDATLPIGVLAGDLPLLTPESICRLAATDGDVVIAPGLGGGTNGLVVRHPDFSVDYHGASCLDHRSIAERRGATVVEFDSRRVATDLDEPTDFVEVLLHGNGKTAAWLRDAGFRLSIDEVGGRVDVDRSTQPPE